MKHFDRLFSPFKMGGLQVKNRIVMAAMGTNFGTEDGTVSERAISYYAERARGGAGLIITESSPVSQRGRHRRRCLGAFDDRFISGLRHLTDAVHESGALIALQLNHAGRCAGSDVAGYPPQAPSPIPLFQGAPLPSEMTLKEIGQTAIDFGQMARRARDAGFDAVEIHGAHGYLINQFLSPRLNRRDDAYGGSVENRGRFAVEIVRSVREAVGASFPVIFRHSLRELVEGGYELEDGLFWARHIEAAGADALNVSGGTQESYHAVVQFISPMSFPEGCFIPLAEAAKKAVHIPVIVANRLNDPSLAEGVLRAGKADFIAVGRNFLTDSHWPVKARSGEVNRIRSCVACNGCIWSLQKANGDVTCFQNAALGCEARARIERVREPKKVVVVGGGPGGMEAARVAARRGHRVILFEKGKKLGGQFLLAAIPPYKKTLEKATLWLIRELEQEGVDIRLDTEATPASVERELPDGVILAAGAFPIVPAVCKGKDVLTAWDVLAGQETGRKVLVLGGGLVGAETAEFLSQRGCQVTIVEMLDELAKDMEGTTRLLLLKRLHDAKVSILLSTKVIEICEGGVQVLHNGEERRLEAETIVLALGSRADAEMRKKWEGKFTQLIAIGDCVDARKAKEAIREGLWAGLRICSD